jgi:hypothetical protein
MGQRVAGTCYVKADGVQFEVSGSWEVPINLTTKETVMGLAGPAGYKEMANRKYMSGEVIFTPGFPVQTLNNMTNATVTLECANGMVGTLTGAWLDGDIALDSVEGKVNLVFAGTDLVWSN